MKKIVLTYGLLGGVVLAVGMIVTMSFHDRIGFSNWAMVLGYACMVVDFLAVYRGVRAYRDGIAGGTVRFGRAFVVGGLIALMGSACYVATWEVIYFRFMPDFMDQYQAHALEQARANGASPQALAAQQEEMARFAAQYRNPAFNVAMTFLEPLPVALLMALVSAALLSRRSRRPETASLAAVALDAPAAPPSVPRISEG